MSSWEASTSFDGSLRVKVGELVLWHHASHCSWWPVASHQQFGHLLQRCDRMKAYQGQRLVTCCDVDRAGARMATGSRDSSVRLYDFHGMDASGIAFRAFQPQQGHAVVGLSYSPTGAQCVAATGSSKGCVFDRNGRGVLVCVKGDPYRADMGQTRGHVSALTGCGWSPREKAKILTCSTDGSARIWDVEKGEISRLEKELVCSQVLKARSLRGGRGGRPAGGLSACAFSPCGTRVCGAAQDGTLQLWALRKASARGPDVVVRSPAAQEHNMPGVSASLRGATGVCWSGDGRWIASRGVGSAARSGGGCVLLWDTRKLKIPVKSFAGLANNISGTSVCFCTGAGVMATCTSGAACGPKVAGTAAETVAPGKVVFLDTKTANTAPLLILGLRSSHQANTCGVSVKWHPVLRQLFFTASDGCTRAISWSFVLHCLHMT